MDEQKKRLMELLDDYGDDIALCDVCERSGDDCLACTNDRLANYLLENGVLAPPCKVGDKLWWVCDNDCKLFNDDPEICVYEEERGVPAIVWDGSKFSVMIDGDAIPFGDQYAFLSEADAEEWLKKHAKENE